jgi:hypothetical protein
MTRRGALAAVALLACTACDRILPHRADLTLPPISEVEAVYERAGLTNGAFAFNGNVVEITVPQEEDQIRRGGSLWARVGPYIYLFTPATREVFDTWEGVAAVRVITQLASGPEIARARLDRGRLSDILWQRSLNILGRALQEGTDRPVLIEDLVNWGEEYTEHRYNPNYVRRSSAR